jgi:alpha-pyrone synthase
MGERRAFINAVAGAVPRNDVHRQFVEWAETRIEDRRTRALFRRMADRSGIEHRWSVIPPAPGGGSPAEPGGFYEGDAPPTSARMRVYAEEAPKLALAAIERLRETVSIAGVTHLVVASCTGFIAPGIDQIIAERLGMEGVERTLVGFMGCYAAVAALRLARHVVRSEPDARVLVVTVELSSIHLAQEQEIEPLLAMLQFSDGAAAALVTADATGFAIETPFSLTLPDSDRLIRWTIGDHGFSMHLSGEVPGRIGQALELPSVRQTVLNGWAAQDVSWAVHAGGRSILDAVEKGLDLPQGALAASRQVLASYGNMSSSTLMFVLADLIEHPGVEKGVALAFGPGLAAEGFRFGRPS